MLCSECRLFIEGRCYSSSRASIIAQELTQATDIMIYANYTEELAETDCKYGVKKGVKVYEKAIA